MNGNPDLISDYQVDWTATDSLVNPMANNGFVIVPWIGYGVTSNLPVINGKRATPDTLGHEQYLGCIYRYARATVRRYRDRIHHWMIEGELNEAQLTALFGWREGSAWTTEEFLTKLIATLHDAVRAEDPDAKIVIVFHTDIHEGIHHDVRPGFINGAMLAGPYHWTEWLEKWKQYLDIVGIDCYSNYYTADPIYGADIGDRVTTAKGIVPDKPVIVFETAYPTAAPDVTLPDPVSFTEEKQARYVGSAINSAIDSGANGFFYFTLQSKGMTGGYTDADLDALRVLGNAFRDGDAEALINFLISDLTYVQEKLPGVLKKVEHGWGLVREDGSKRPGFYVLQEMFSTIPDTLPSDGTFTVELEAGWNLISLPLQPEDTSLDSALASIQGEYSSIWAYDAANGQWLSRVTDRPSFLSNLDEVKSGAGYWVMMDTPSSLSIQGERSAISIPLDTGWNLIGYDSLTTKTLEEALSSIAGNYESVWTYDAVYGEWKRYVVDAQDPLNDLEIIEPGKGYWINMSQPGMLIMD
ncbi:hypothetical protein ACFL6S_35935 [Candidatus Poribacteria bacterium]